MENEKEVRRYFAEGKRLLNGKDYRGAITALSNYLRNVPDDEQANFYRGKALYFDGNYELAVEDYSKVIGLNPNNAFAYHGLGDAQSKMRMYDSALENYNKAIEINPNEENFYISRGYAWYCKKDYGKAIGDYNSGIKLKSNEADFYINLGDALLMSGAEENALDNYDKGIQLNPDNPESYLSRGFFHFRRENYEDALKDCDKAVELNPNHVEAHRFRGSVWNAKWESDREEDAYSKAIKDYGEAIRLGGVFSGAEQPRAVLVALKKAHDSQESVAKEIDRKFNIQLENFKEEMSKNIKSFQEEMKGRIELKIDELKNQGKNHHRKAWWYGAGFFTGTLILFSVLALYAWCHLYLEIWLSGNSVATEGNGAEKDPFIFLPWLLLAAAVSAPVVVVLRALESRRNESLSLAFDFDRKLMLEERITTYAAYDEKLRDELLRDYVKHWMENSPVEVLAALRKKKKSDPVVMPPSINQFLNKE